MHRVLIVEPDATLRADLVAAVSRAGYVAEGVATAAGALERLGEAPADILVAAVSGPDALADLNGLRCAAPDASLVAMTRDPTPALAVGALASGAGALLRKPFRLDALERALAGACRGGPGPAVATRDPGMRRVLREAHAAAQRDATVQIVGEDGTGKERLARRIHAESARRGGPLVTVPCAALPGAAAAGALLGFAAGTPEAPDAEDPGRAGAADGGTLVLQDVAALPADAQPGLLRLLQERERVPVGGARPRGADVRVIVTSRRELDAEVAAGRLRRDLQHRLDVIVLRIPPLRERPADLPLLATELLRRFAQLGGVAAPRLGEDALARLAEHPFPGNLRELENLMRRAVVLHPGEPVDADALLRAPGRPAQPSGTWNLKELERRTIARSLEEFGGNRTRAARALGISDRTLREKIRRYELT